MAKKVSELQGAELDRWVVNAHGMMLYHEDWQPSRNWAQGGPLIEQNNICVMRGEHGQAFWEAARHDGMGGGFDSYSCFQYSDSYLEAAMRCYVASKFGDEVSDELA